MDDSARTEGGNLCMKKTHKNMLQAVIIILIIFGIGGYVLSAEETAACTSVSNCAQKETQEGKTVIIEMKNYNYYPNTIQVPANTPITITLDASVKGCLRSFTIPALKIQKYLQTPKDTLTVTFPQPGTYKFACSMGMGTGTFIVE